jgi:hypothetical protein
LRELTYALGADLPKPKKSRIRRPRRAPRRPSKTNAT